MDLIFVIRICMMNLYGGGSSLFGVWAFGLLFFEGLMLGDIIHIIVVYG
jgi:hypothetical protein